MTIIVAHRGASGMAPENTMEAFRLGVEAGADAIELDVHLTADGQLAVIHDETLDRTTDRTGRVADLTMDEIREADAGARIRAARTTRAIRSPGSGLTRADAARGARVAARHDRARDRDQGARGRRRRRRGHRRPSGAGRTAASRSSASTRPRSIACASSTRAFGPGTSLAPGQSIDEAFAWASGRGHTGVHPWEGDLGADPLPILAQAKILGLEVGCYVVNDPGRMQFLSDTGLWGFVTDVPDVAVETLGRS